MRTGRIDRKVRKEYIMCKINDSYFETYGDFETLKNDEAAARKEWRIVKISDIAVSPFENVVFSDAELFKKAPAYAPEITVDAVKDTAANTGLAVIIDGKGYPVRDTALPSMFARARINGFSLAKLEKTDLSMILNKCNVLYGDNALVLFDEEKVSATHSGGDRDYSILPIPALLDALTECLDSRFPGYEFVRGYRDHSYTACEFKMPDQKDDLLRGYEALLKSEGKDALAGKLIPGLKFMSSDVGLSAARVSAFLTGTTVPIIIGSCIAVEHKHGATVEQFREALNGVFVKFGDALGKLAALHEVVLSYPVNAMTRVCKHLHLPKKASLEAISMFEDTNGNVPASAADVYFAMQEIMCNLGEKTNRFVLEENLARALTLNWKTFDLAKPVEW